VNGGKGGSRRGGVDVGRREKERVLRQGGENGRDCGGGKVREHEGK
jgi:hypothetical protein